jgi:hypothetical protein
VEAGEVRYGTFSGPIADVNLIDACPWPLPVPRPLRALRLKEWQAFQFGNRTHFGVVALFNAKLVALAQVKLYDRRQRRLVSFERKLPGWAFDVPRNLLHSACEWSDSGALVRFENRLADGRLEVVMDIAETSAHPAIRGRLVADARGSEPQVVSIPFARGHGMYSHKAHLPVTGELWVASERVAFSQHDSVLCVDDHKGFYPYVMRWDWLVGAGFDEHGVRIGLNLTRNESRDPEQFNENCLWIDGKRHLLPSVGFTRDDRCWRIRDQAGEVNVEFDVEASSQVEFDAWVIESRYRGPFGQLRGHVTGPSGANVSLEGFAAMGEDFYLRC